MNTKFATFISNDYDDQKYRVIYILEQMLHDYQLFGDFLITTPI